MQTLGLSDSTPRTESRWRALFWPTIRNVGDFDYVTRQGLWICYIVAVATTVLSAFSGFPLAGAFEGVFYFLAGLGVRQRNRFAGIAAFVGYLLSGFVLQRYAGNGFGVGRIIFLALLFANIRGNWLAARWASEEQLEYPPMRLNQTLADKLSDQLPIWLWPKVRIAFYVIAVLEITFLLLALFAPLP
ncbi:MAG: hypothetical protein QM757_14865 [Paludibaculum sp.]